MPDCRLIMPAHVCLLPVADMLDLPPALEPSPAVAIPACLHNRLMFTHHCLLIAWFSTDSCLPCLFTPCHFLRSSSDPACLTALTFSFHMPALIFKDSLLLTCLIVSLPFSLFTTIHYSGGSIFRLIPSARLRRSRPRSRPPLSSSPCSLPQCLMSFLFHLMPCSVYLYVSWPIRPPPPPHPPMPD